MKSFRLLAAVVASALLISPCFAEDKTAGALAPGKPAGVHKAAIGTSIIYGAVIVTLIAAGAILIVNNEGSTVSPTNTTP